MIKLTQQAIVDLFVEKLMNLGCKRLTKTVNRQDPTEITTIEGEVGVEHGLGLALPKAWEPVPQIVKVKVLETPWGTEINFGIVENESAVISPVNVKWESGYLDDDNKWHRVTSEDFFNHLKRLINESQKAEDIRSMLEQDDTHGYGNFV